MTRSGSVFREDGEEHLSEVHVFRDSTGGLENVFSDEEAGMNERGSAGAAPQLGLVRIRLAERGRRSPQ